MRGCGGLLRARPPLTSRVTLTPRPAHLYRVCRREAGGCAHEFCWQCLNTWASHITAGGSGYQCNKRPDKLTFDEEKSSLAKNNLDFYMFYHGKVVSQSADRRHAIAELAKYDDKVSVMTATLTASGFVPPYGTFQFFKEALQTVVNSRLVAKYAYVHAFFLDKGPELNLFEFSQALMEQNIEKLVSLIGDRTLSEVFQKQRENKTAWDVRPSEHNRRPSFCTLLVTPNPPLPPHLFNYYRTSLIGARR